jgi:excinuclease ABC subunit A
MGPGGGNQGGEIVYAGDRLGIDKEPRSLTGQALKKWAKPVKKARQ